MSTSFYAHVHHSFESPSETLFGGRANGSPFREGNNPISSLGLRRSFGAATCTLSNLAKSLNEDNENATVPAKIIGADHATLVRWIRDERMQKLPPEGSSYDKVLVWARLFLDRLHAFDVEIQKFAGDSHMATQLAYVHCASLLGLGEENASALLDVFSFFYRCSMSLENLLGRAELFAVSQHIKDQLVLGLADLITLVVGISTHFRQSLGHLTTGTVSIDIYNTFMEPIASFRSRCEHASELMWRHQIKEEGLDRSKVTEIAILRKWLDAEDPVLGRLTESTAQFAQEREESTCLWVKPHLTGFLKGKKPLLAFSGKPGCGKSILATVINDHLQYPIRGVAYQSIFVPINARVPIQTTPRAVVKSILSQLLASRIGNVSLYQILSSTYERCESLLDEQRYDSLLWDALKHALQSSLEGAKPLVLIVDGVEESSCGQKELLEKLNTATADLSNLKLIVLASDEQEGLPPKSVVQITPDLVFDDITAVVRKILQHCPTFNEIFEQQQEMTVTRIVEAADGSFLWAKLVAKRIRDVNASSSQALTKVINDLLKANHSIADLVSHRLRSKTLQDDAKQVVAWLATAFRPLSVGELSSLLSVRLEQGSESLEGIDPLSLLKPLSSLVFYQNNMVYLRHGQVRAAVIEEFSKPKANPQIRDSHLDLVQRLLLSMKYVLPEETEPSLSPLDSQRASTVLGRHPILHYAVRYWVDHTRMLFDFTNGEKLSEAGKLLNQALPTSLMAPLLAMTVWNNRPAPVQASLYDTQVHIYRQVLKDRHPAVLQTVLCEAIFYHKYETVQPALASEVFYTAAKIAQQVLSVQHVITMQMTSYFLEMTSKQVTTTKSTVMMRRIEMLQLLVECYRIHYGPTSDRVTSALAKLAQHYTLIEEYEKSQEITASLQRRTVEDVMESTKSRRGSDESLLVELHSRRDSTGQEANFDLDEVETDQLLTTAFNFESSLAEAVNFAREGDVGAAERAYVDIWQHTSEEHRIHHNHDSQLRVLKAVQAYAEFLKSQKRTNDAASILSGFWEQHERTISNSEDVGTQLLQMATLMRTLGMPCQALSVLTQSCQGIGKRVSVHTKIQDEILSVSKEVSRSATTSTATMTESKLQELAFGGSSADQLSSTAASTLLKRYLSQDRWKDAAKTIKKMLQEMWPSLFTSSADDVVLPTRNVQRCIELTGHLRSCYQYKRQMTKEEDLARRVFCALRRDRKAGDKLLETVSQDLLHFYHRTSQTDKLISTHETILGDYSSHFGEDSPTLLKELWTLAELTGPGAASLPYYQRIVRILNGDSDTCHPDAFEPLSIVVAELVNQGRFRKARHPCQVLFNSLQQGKKHAKIRDQTFVETTYKRYVQCLKATGADSRVIHDVTAQYRKLCLKTFGSSATITVEATKTLISICQGSREYEAEMVQLYESLLNTTSDLVDVDRKDIQATLDAIYEDQAAQVTSIKASTSSEHMQRAISLYTRRLSSTRSTYGWAHESSLSQMEELVSVYARQRNTDGAATLLRDTTVHILSSNQEPAQLNAAAKSLACSYKTAGLADQGDELAQTLYRQLIAMDTGDVHLNLTSNARQNLLFLAQFECSLRDTEDRSLNVNEIYSCLMSEYLYFERFRVKVSKRSSNLKSVIYVVSQLKHILQVRGRHATASRLVERFTNYFIATEGERLEAKLAEASEFITTLLDYFETHSSVDFLRSVAIASDQRVMQLISAKQYRSATDLALIAFKYIRAHRGLSSFSTVKLLLRLGLTISGLGIRHPRPDSATRKTMLATSATILSDLLTYFKTNSIDMAGLDVSHLNTLIGVLDTQKDYQNLAWILTSLWEKREQHPATKSDTEYTFALGRMLIVTRYLVGDYMSAIRLAEDMVYNCVRVHGPRHPSTVEMTVLLSQMYTSVAQGHQNDKDHRALASRYYKKAAALHENALRGFMDPSSVAAGDGDEDASSTSSVPSSPGEDAETSGKSVRQHLHLLKLAVERLGSWPKDYSEYEQLNTDLFTMFGNELEGVQGMDKWDLKNFGSGCAEASDDLITFWSQSNMPWRGLAIPI